MTGTFSLNSLDLTPENSIFITEDISFDPSSSSEVDSVWHGTDVFVKDIQPKATKVTIKGHCTTEAALRSIAKYHITNYNFNVDTEDLYLIKDLSKRWKIYALDLSYDNSHPGMPYPFTMNLTLSKIGAEGYVQTSKTGSSSSSSVSITPIINAGDSNAVYDSIKITGTYSGGANLTAPHISQYLIGYTLNIADVILDTAYYEFYSDYTAKHTYTDAFNNTNGFTRNKSSSTNVTFSTNHLIIAASGELKYRFQLTHPLLSDPVLTLSTSSVVGTPKLEVSSDNVNWWECEKGLTSGGLIGYNLTKLAGYSDFYFRITTGTTSSLNLSYMKLVSWHNYSGQKPIPYLRANSVSERLDISFSAGTLDYDVRYRDRWTA